MLPTTPAALLPIDRSYGLAGRAQRRRGWTHRLRLALFLGLAGALAAGCGGGGGGSGGGGEPTVSVNAHGRVALGGVGGGSVEVYRLGDYGTPVATATTSTGPDLVSTGSFDFTLTDVPADAMFLLVASGGQAHDADEDGVLDGPALNLGKVHALASVADLQQQTVRLSAVTEVVYQRVRYFLEALYGDAYVAQACDAWSTFVLRTSIDGLPGVRNGDALAFDPRLHTAKTVRLYSAQFSAFVLRLLGGQTLTKEAFELSAAELHFEDLQGETYGVDLVGALAYVCRGGGGLDVWNVADPTVPVKLGNVQLSGSAVQVQVVGTRAYVAGGAGGLQILDVSVASAPSVLRTVPTIVSVSDLHVVGDRAYLVGGSPDDARLMVVDITTPAAAAIVGDCALGDAPSGVRVTNGCAYVMEYGLVEVFDVGDPTQPEPVGALSTQGYYRLDVGLGHLFVATWGHLEVFSLEVPAAPVSVASLPLPGLVGIGPRIRGTQALVPTGSDGVAVVDVSDPANPVFSGLLPTSGYVGDIDREGGVIVTTELNAGLSTVVAGTPAPSGVVASLPRTGSVSAVEAEGNRIYLATYNPSALVVLDATNPLAPVELGTTPLAGTNAFDIALQGQTALLGEYGGLYAYDVADPAAPQLLGGSSTFDVVLDLALAGDVAYATIGNSQLLATFDISNPAAPTVLASWLVPGGPTHLEHTGSALVIAGGNDGTLTFNVTTPTSPSPAGQLDTAYSYDVALSPPYAFVAQQAYDGVTRGLRVVDISTLHAPTSVAFVQLPGTIERVVRSGTRVYACSHGTGVHVVDVAVPTAPVYVGTIPVPADIADLTVAGGTLYSAVTRPNGAVLMLRAAQVAVP